VSSALFLRRDEQCVDTAARRKRRRRGCAVRQSSGKSC